jgi:hypothetical protein
MRRSIPVVGQRRPGRAPRVGNLHLSPGPGSRLHGPCAAAQRQVASHASTLAGAGCEKLSHLRTPAEALSDSSSGSNGSFLRGRRQGRWVHARTHARARAGGRAGAPSGAASAIGTETAGRGAGGARRAQGRCVPEWERVGGIKPCGEANGTGYCTVPCGEGSIIGTESLLLCGETERARGAYGSRCRGPPANGPGRPALVYMATRRAARNPAA